MNKLSLAARAALITMLMASAVAAGACSRTPATPPGLTDSGTLQACPDSPNCVSSLATDEEHMTEALPLLGEPDTAIDRLAQLVDQMRGTKILQQDEEYLAIECRTTVLRFADDLEFLLDEENGLIHVRSASRTGYSDLGVNGRRVEKVRDAWLEANPAE